MGAGPSGSASAYHVAKAGLRAGGTNQQPITLAYGERNVVTEGDGTGEVSRGRWLTSTACSRPLPNTFLNFKEEHMAIKKVGVVGCGLMGAGIAQVAAQAGYDTISCAS